jgi:hypothetical protein
MTDRTRSTTLRLRLPPTAAAGVAPSPAGLPPRIGLEPQRFGPRPVVAVVPRGLDPTSKAILQELASLGLVEKEDLPQ